MDSDRNKIGCSMEPVDMDSNRLECSTEPALLKAESLGDWKLENATMAKTAELNHVTSITHAGVPNKGRFFGSRWVLLSFRYF